MELGKGCQTKIFFVLPKKSVRVGAVLEKAFHSNGAIIEKSLPLVHTCLL